MTYTAGLERARQIYQEGKKTQIQQIQQREATAISENKAGAPSMPVPGRVAARKQRILKIKAEVALPAEWHTMQAKIESLGADGLARAKIHWLKFSTKLQVMNGCVDFLNLSKLINNVKLDQPYDDSDSDSDDNKNKNEVYTCVLLVSGMSTVLLYTITSNT